VRSITIIAIIAAVSVGAAGIAIVFSSGYIGNLDWSKRLEPEKQQQNLAANVTVPSSIDYKRIDIKVNGISLTADIAETSEQKSKGLGGRDALADDAGMIFPFNKESDYSFWMKGMKFSIDIIWIDSDKRVVHIEHDLDPCEPNSFCPSYSPKEDSLYVLETVAGFADRYNVTKGTQIQFDLAKKY
jgi:uncharacterized protein